MTDLAYLTVAEGAALLDRELEDRRPGCAFLVSTHDPGRIDRGAWDALAARSSQVNPFVAHDYLVALHNSRSAIAATGCGRGCWGSRS